MVWDRMWGGSELGADQGMAARTAGLDGGVI